MSLIWFYWDGPISENRLRILKDSVYSTRIFNPEKEIRFVSNSIEPSTFDLRYNIRVVRWDKNIFDNTPISSDKVDEYTRSSPRDFSDLFRLILLYKYGGTYIDTDDLCIAPISETRNLVCRSYDPHTSFYNNVDANQCIDGSLREIRGYDHIPMFPRNDCWQNWDRKHPLIYDILTHDSFSKDFIWIGGNSSWQSISNEICVRWADRHKLDWNLGLTLWYLFEDFVAYSSFWDRCEYGGEMCDIWNNLPDIGAYEWGKYRCDRYTAISTYKKVIDTYPNLSHLWLHSKDMNQEWIEDIDYSKMYAISTWILNEVRNKIYEW